MNIPCFVGNANLHYKMLATKLVFGPQTYQVATIKMQNTVSLFVLALETKIILPSKL